MPPPRRSSRRPARSKAERRLAVLAAAARLLVAPFARFRVEGGACAVWVEECVVVANHRSLFDVVAGLVGFRRFGRYPRLLVAAEFVSGRWTGPFARAIGAIPVDRSKGRSGAVDAAVRALHDGAVVLVMPEGRLNAHADPLSTRPVRPGLSRIAVGAGVPVVAAAVVGADQVWPAGSPLPRLRRPSRRPTVTVRLDDEPIYLEGEDHQANAELVMQRVRDLLALSAG